MIRKLNTSRSAIFLKATKSLSKTFIKNVFREVSKDRIGNFIEHTIHKVVSQPVSAKLSFLVFKIKDEPSFLKNSGLTEHKFAFLLIIEMNDYIVILKKHVFGLDKLLKDHCSKLNYEEIQYLFSNQEPSYEKMSLSMMGISRAAILRKTLESMDLTGQLGSQSSRRSIPTSTTVKTKEHRHILRPNSSSISKTDNKSSLSDLLGWINDVCVELTKSNRQSNFLDSFAQPVKLNAIKELDLKPTAVLLNLSELKDSLTTDSEILFSGTQMDSKRIHSLINFLESTFLVELKDQTNEIFYINRRDEKKNVGTVRLNEKSITLSSPWLSLFTYKRDDGFESSLQKYINTYQLFTLTFDSPEYIHLDSKLFRDKGISTH